MAEHKDIQEPEDYTEADYMEFERKLFSPLVQKSELEDICMTLAHLPTKQAQDILIRFRESRRASEVEWLDCAVEEGDFLYLSPTNEQEERDYLALKVMQEMWDETIELQVKHDEVRLELDMLEIRYEAIKSLVKKGEIEETEAIGLENYKIFRTSEMETLARDISVKEKIFDQIKASIRTAKYKEVDPTSMRHVHFT
ncbi:hypothetical protein [Desulfonema magnum]|uniref:Uncharacterized protein n=1 Tax=Desulfonema magnum TaxID=45655 RepID=A0A975BLP5_9BACT|nr:hypothetical protein [Desulfonema magnum]QTA87741.1 Uncharacterized protein dnm_037780 [Desulfonema magnum]